MPVHCIVVGCSNTHSEHSMAVQYTIDNFRIAFVGLLMLNVSTFVGRYGVHSFKTFSLLYENANVRKML